MLGMTQRIAPSQVGNNKAFGLLLHLLRKMAGLTMGEVGAALGYTGGNIGYREKGQRLVNIEQAAAMLELYGYGLYVMHQADAARIPGLLISPADPCAAGCADPARHAEGGHDV